MTPQEFKAWFDGFTEAFTGCPTKAQWGRIKERVSEIDGRQTTHTVYMDRYVERYPYLRPYWGYGAAGIGLATSGNMAAASQQYALAQNISNQFNQGQATFNSLSAMNDAGRAEAKEIA